MKGNMEKGRFPKRPKPQARSVAPRAPRFAANIEALLVGKTDAGKTYAREVLAQILSKNS